MTGIIHSKRSKRINVIIVLGLFNANKKDILLI